MICVIVFLSLVVMEFVLFKDNIEFEKYQRKVSVSVNVLFYSIL